MQVLLEKLAKRLPSEGEVAWIVKRRFTEELIAQIAVVFIYDEAAPRGKVTALLYTSFTPLNRASLALSAPVNRPRCYRIHTYALLLIQL
ncbi:hypothetical protein EON80_06610 [bacterium]|nr:MAG: hypothetical protein EON80_06610 [bacterium]